MALQDVQSRLRSSILRQLELKSKFNIQENLDVFKSAIRSGSIPVIQWLLTQTSTIPSPRGFIEGEEHVELLTAAAASGNPKMFTFVLKETKIRCNVFNKGSLYCAGVIHNKPELMELISMGETIRKFRVFSWSFATDDLIKVAIQSEALKCIEWISEKYGNICNLLYFPWVSEFYNADLNLQAYDWLWKRKEGLKINFDSLLQFIARAETPRNSTFDHFFLQVLTDNDWEYMDTSLEKILLRIVRRGQLVPKVDQQENIIFAEWMATDQNWKILKLLVIKNFISVPKMKSIVSHVYGSKEKVQKLIKQRDAKEFIDWVKSSLSQY